MSVRSAIWLDGSPTSVLPLPDRGLDFGDGLFETLLLLHGRALFTEMHLERLKLGLQALAFPDCLLAASNQLNIASSAIAKEGWRWTALRLSVTRGGGPRGYAPPDKARPRIVLNASKLDRDCGKMSTAATLSVATIRLSAQPLLAGIKHLNRLEQVLAAAQGQAAGTDECIVLDQSGYLISVVAGNLFLVRRGELLTPKLVNCGVVGTRRRLIIEQWAPSIGLKVREARLTLQDLKDSDEVFYSNSLLGVRPVERLDERCWNSHSVCEELFQRYLEEFA